MTIVPSFLKAKPLFTRVIAALLVSGVGTALTSVAVYQELARLRIGSVGFAIAFAAGVVPGLFASMVSGARAQRWRIGPVLICAQLAGLAGLIFPLLGYSRHAVSLLLMSEVMSSAVSGFLVPVYKGFERSSFVSEEFSKLAALDTFVFIATFILGQGFGSLVAAQVPFRGFLLIDALTYVAALLLLLPVSGRIPALEGEDEGPAPVALLTPEQRRALIVPPWLALVCAPAMILLPARAAQWGTSFHLIGPIVIAPVLFLLCVRTIGQIVGPLLALRLDLAQVCAHAWALPLALLAYLVLYVGAYTSNSLVTVGIYVVLAHTASNVVYTAGNYQLLSAFDPVETVWASGWTYRVTTLIVATSGIAMGWLSDRVGIGAVFAVCTAAFIAGTAALRLVPWKSPSFER